MKLQSIQYQHPETGITFEIEFKGEDNNKYITVRTRHDDDEFMFKNSKAETLIMIGQALLEIGTFCAKIKLDEFPITVSYNLD